MFFFIYNTLLQLQKAKTNISNIKRHFNNYWLANTLLRSCDLRQDDKGAAS